MADISGFPTATHDLLRELPIWYDITSSRANFLGGNAMGSFQFVNLADVALQRDRTLEAVISEETQGCLLKPNHSKNRRSI